MLPTAIVFIVILSMGFMCIIYKYITKEGSYKVHPR
jgi:hypothetical protein